MIFRKMKFFNFQLKFLEFQGLDVKGKLGSGGCQDLPRGVKTTHPTVGRGGISYHLTKWYGELYNLRSTASLLVRTNNRALN